MSTVYPRTSSLAIVNPLFGILAYAFLPGIGALVAVTCGHAARSEIRRAPPGSIDGGGDGITLAGWLPGWIQLAIVLNVLALVAMIVAAGWTRGGIYH